MICPTLFVKNVRHLRDGGHRQRHMYFATVVACKINSMSKNGHFGTHRISS
jgi:hypothetical protein